MSRPAEQLGVSFVTVNRWEIGQSRPPFVAPSYRDCQRARQEKLDALGEIEASAPENVPLDFTRLPEVMQAIAEGERLLFGCLVDPALATEISRIDPLPHH